MLILTVLIIEIHGHPWISIIKPRDLKPKVLMPISRDEGNQNLKHHHRQKDLSLERIDEVNPS